MKYNSSNYFLAVSQILSESVKTKKRISVADFQVKTGLSKRSSQRYLKMLSNSNILIADGNVPQGFIPTEMAKDIFGGASETP